MLIIMGRRLVQIVKGVPGFIIQDVMAQNSVHDVVVLNS
jgi:hypothetical protein